MSDEETANLVLKRMLEHFLKVPSLKKLEFQNHKKDYEICTKRKFRTKIKPMIENLQDELCQ